MAAPVAALLLLGGLTTIAAEAAPPAPRTCLGAPVTIHGTPGDDVLRGTRGPDVIVGGGGDDRITGRGGNDLICGGPGRDRIAGSAGADRLDGGGGKDALTGGPGDDALNGGAARDRCVGGPGKDVLQHCEGPNAAPKAVADAASTDEDTAVTVAVLDNDSDSDRDRLVVSAVEDAPAQGEVTVLKDGTGVRFDPSGQYDALAGGATATRTFSYTVSDRHGGTDTAKVTVTITGLDDLPAAGDDTATVTEDAGATAIDVLADDGDADGGPVTITSATQPDHGTVVVADGGSDLTYAPDADYCNDGTPTDDFTYTVTGGSTATVEVTVTCVDDAPTAVDDTRTVAEDSGATAIDVLANDTDPDDGPRSITAVTQPARGSVTFTAAGLSYRPSSNYCTSGSTTDDFTYTLNGGSTATVRVTVTCVDDPASAFDDAPAVAEDSGATTIDVLANDSDPEGAQLTITAATDPANGTVVVAGDRRSLTYEPDADYCNAGPTTDTFSYTIDGGSTATVRVRVTCVDDPGVATGDTATVVEDVATTIDVLANDVDPDGGVITEVTQPAHGTVTITHAGSDVRYEPDADYCNDGTTTDDFTYTVNGGSTATVEVTVTCVDDDPTAVDDTRTVSEDAGATTVDVLANDTDPDGGALEITGTSDPTHGTVVVAGDGSDLTYAPDADYCNDGTTTDDFTYTVNGGSTATVEVTVTCVDDDPTAVDDTRTVSEDAGATTVDVLANDANADGGPQTVESVTQPTNGSVAFTAADLSYTPDADYCNDGTTTDDFTYTVNGGSTATVEVTVTCVDDDPTAVDDVTTVAEDTPTTIDVLANDTDDDGGQLTVTGASDPTNGTVVVAGDGSDLTYTPDADYCNDGTTTDDFTYTVNGGSTATVEVTVTCANDAPVVDLDTGSPGIDSAATFDETNPHAGNGVLVAPDAQVSDSDDTSIESATVTLTDRLDGDAFESLSADIPAGSGITLVGGSYDAATGTLAFTGTASKADYTTLVQSIRYDNTQNPPDPTSRTITVTVGDGDLTSDPADAVVEVRPINAPPGLDLDTVGAGDDSAVTFVEDGGAVAIAPDAAVSDSDDTDLESATVVLTARPDGNGAESLEFTIPQGSGISAGSGYDAATGTLSFTGTSTLASYEALIRSIRYVNTDDDPDATDRTVTVTVDDGLAESSSRTATVSITATNDEPTLDLDSNEAGTGSAAAFTEGDAATALAPDASIADVDSATLVSATITLTARPDGGSESLAVTIPGGSPISIVGGAYDAGTGVLALSGTATKAQYEDVIQTLTYANTDQDPDGASRSVTVTVNDGDADSAASTATVTVTPVNDAPAVDLNGAGGGIDSAAAFTEDSAPANPGSGAVALASLAVVTDVDSASLTGATITLTNHPYAASESLSVVTSGTSVVAAVYNSATGVLALSGSASKAQYQQVIRTLKYDNTSNTPGTADRDVTVVVTDAGPLASPVAHATVSVTATNDAPVPVNDTFDGSSSAVGNTALAVGTSHNEPSKTFDCTIPTTCSVLTRGTDDSDPDGPGPLVVGPTGAQAITTADGGKVTLEADGNFTYFPAANDPGCADGSDSFSYTLSDQGTNGTATGTVTIAVADCVWYVDSAVAGPGTGTSTDPFKTLAGINGAGGAGDADGTGDTLMILTATSYTGGLPLEGTQALRSKRAGLSVGGFTVVTASGASNPTISNASGPALALASNNAIQGVDLGTTPAGSAALSGSSVGTATMNTTTSGVINNTTGGAVDISGGTVAMTFTSVTSNGATGDGIRLDNVAGTFTGSGGSLQNAGGEDVDLSGNGSSDDVAFTYNGTITDDVGTLVNVSGQNGGTKDFNGSITDGNDGDGSGISLASNTGATIRFDGGVTLSTGANAAFSATGGGTVVVADTNAAGSAPDNVVTTTSGAALTVTSTTIGADGLDFTSISANGAPKAITLNTTGSAGGLTVSGTGTAGSGGTVQNSSTRGAELISTSAVSLSNMNFVSANSSADGGGGGACDDLVITACNAAIYLNSVTGATLNRINLSGTMVENGITGVGVSGLVMSNSSITGAGNEAHESGMELQNLSGTSSITDTEISFSETNSIDIVNTDVGLNLTLDGVTLRDTQTVSSGGASNGNGEGGLQFRSFSSAGGQPTTNLDIVDSSLLRLRTQAVQVVGEDDSIVNVDITGTTIDSGSDIGAGIDLNGNDTAAVRFNVIGNPLIRSQGGSAVNVTSFLNASIMGRINNNTDIEVNSIGSGIRVLPQESSTGVVEARNNVITMNPGNNSTPIDSQARFEDARLDLTLDNNTTTADTLALADINITAGSSLAGETNVVCADVKNHTAVPPGGNTLRSLRLRVSDLSNTIRMYLEGFVTDSESTWDAPARSNSPTAGQNVNLSITGSGVFPSAPPGGVCAEPTNAMP
ncbi:Ig-like domain-containing protein [Nocardioides sp. SR21]|uniref:Ig-like domain-containing protein n=1 Tax=Nocardioides sp. SR21 TaxID=2919501 RepID=UPI001FAA82D7|nr:Ig-like domain-containing protein [Nocardioides sp. SR21]